MIKLAPHEVQILTALLSRERLARLIALTGSDLVAIELHQETLALGASLMNVTGVVEIAMRNAVCENLQQRFLVADWLVSPPPPFMWKAPESLNIQKAADSAKRAVYAKLSQAEKAALDGVAFPAGRPAGLLHLTRAKRRRAHIEVSQGKVVAELTLYFWKRLYGPDYDQALWKTSLKKTFPDKKLARADVAAQLEHIYQSRNRLAHHEPVLHKRLQDTLNAIEFIAHRLGVSKPTADTPLAKLISADLAEVQRRAKALHARLASYKSADANTPGPRSDEC